ncbi:MAG: hypothetical protein ACI8UO_001910 [Verrucomicrobiales bacterium]|jgi:hypothetical protein
MPSDQSISGYFVILSAILATSVFAKPIDEPIQQLLSQYCLDCHDAESQKGDLDLERFTSIAEIAKDSAVWEHVLQQIEDGEMPPKKKPQFTAEEREQFKAWVQQTLNSIALANAGDPGPVVLRRLSNMEFTYTIRDLTGVEALDPAREFPIDGAAGEGFTNVGSALVMSPALLTKYLDAAKEVASHAVILPDRIEFSPSAHRADWTQEKLAAIRAIYSRFAATDGSAIPLERYLRAILTGDSDGLSQKYLAMLKNSLESDEPSALLDPLRKRMHEAKPEDATAIAKEISAWQNGLWHFAKIGHIGKRDGPPSWQIPVSPVVTSQLFQLDLAESESDPVLYLAAGDAGDGPEGDAVIWKNAVLTRPDEKPIPLSQLKALNEAVIALQDRELKRTGAYLESAAKGETVEGLDPAISAAWTEMLRLGGTSLIPTGHLVGDKENVAGYAFVRGLGPDLPIVLVNQSDGPVDIGTLTVPARGLTVHPTPTEACIVVWKSPVSSEMSIKGSVADGDNKCGNGAVWTLEIVNASGPRKLVGGPFANGAGGEFTSEEKIAIQAGDLVRLTVGSHQKNHTCDTTAVNLTLTEIGGKQRVWDLAGDVVDRLGKAGNPMADTLGNEAVWHFCKSGDAGAGNEFVIPADSALGRWKSAVKANADNPDSEAVKLALLAPESDADRAVAEEIRRWRGPFRWIDKIPAIGSLATSDTEIEQVAPSVLEFAIPAELIAKGAKFTATVELHPDSGAKSSVQAFATLTKPQIPVPLSPGTIQAAGPGSGGSWTAGTPPVVSTRPILVHEGSDAQRQFADDVAEFQALFPAALSYRKIVPVDEVVTLTLRYREDDHLVRLMLNDAEAADLDRLWDEMRFVSRQPLQQLDAFNQLWQYATQDADPSAFEPMRKPINQAATSFEKRLIDVQPEQVAAVLEFAERAWRRPLTENDRAELLALYNDLRIQELDHESAVRQLLTRILVAPAFLYRGEVASPGVEASPVSDWELATRLSYFLWSSGPDAELRASAAAGELRNPDVLAAQIRRMVSDARIRRLATEFGAQWLHVRDLETLDEKSERHFPTFLDLRDEMQEETVLFFIDLLQNDRSVLSLLDADHSFVNRPLAEHYGIEFAGDDWRRVDGLREMGRGGILGFSATLAKHSGASRTSPILRGNWVSEVLLGEKLPKPPKDVPLLPEEAPDGLTERQLIERHSSDPSCARCHAKIDPLGFALEGFDAIGRSRDGADTHATLADGTEFDGINGLRNYLVETRSEDFVRQFCRKLLGYALGRSVQLSDKPLLDEMTQQLLAEEAGVSAALELIVRSPQFREVRGRDFQTAH